MHDGVDPDHPAVLAVHDGEREASAVRASKRTVHGAADTRALSNQPKNPLDLLKELTPQARGLLLVEANGLRVLSHCLRVESDYHPKRARTEVSASSTGIASTAPDRSSRSRRRISSIHAASTSASYDN